MSQFKFRHVYVVRSIHRGCDFKDDQKLEFDSISVFAFCRSIVALEINNNTNVDSEFYVLQMICEKKLEPSRRHPFRSSLKSHPSRVTL